MPQGPENPNIPQPGLPQPGMPEAGKGQEIPIELRELFERSGGLPVEGADLIENIQLAEVHEGSNISELTQEVEQALAFMEGLPATQGRICNIDIDPQRISEQSNKAKIVFWKNLYTTGESSTKRPRTASYLQIALEECTDKRIRDAERWRTNPQRYIEKRQKYYQTVNRQRARQDEPPLTQEEIIALINKEQQELLNEYNAAEELLELHNYIDTRGVVDFAFLQRMATCENPKNAAALGGDIRAVTPDSGHWQAFFQTERLGTDFGKKVDTLILEMIKFGLPDERIRQIGLNPIPAEVRRIVDHRVYADGFNNSTEFATWYNYQLKQADGKADVMWNAWKLMLTWEAVEKLGIYVNRKNQKYVLTAPPIGNALMSFTSHLREKRTHEYGLKATGERFSAEKFLTHSGLPISIDVVPDLCEDFLHQTKIKFDQSYLDLNNEFSQKLVEVLNRMRREGVLPKEGDDDYVPRIHKDMRQKISNYLSRVSNQKDVELSLWDLRVYGDWGFSDKTFPWLLSDQPTKDSEAGELPMGAFSLWLLTRSRASTVLEDIKARPELRDLGNPDFFAQRLRNWTKVLGTVKNDVPPQENPRAVLLAAYLRYRYGGTSGEIVPLVKDRKEFDYRTKALSESFEPKKEGREGRGVLVGDVLNHAEACGWLRKNVIGGKWTSDRQWIIESLDLHLGI